MELLFIFIPVTLVLSIMTLWILPVIRVISSKFELWSLKAYFMIFWSIVINISIILQLIDLQSHPKGISFHPVDSPDYRSIELIITQQNMSIILLISVLFTLVMIYSLRYLKWETRLHDRGDYKLFFYILMMAAFIGIQIVIISNDAFTLFVGWEMMVVPGYALIALRPKKEASEAGIKYAILSTTGSIFLFYGIVLLYQVFGTFNLTIIKEMISHELLVKPDNLVSNTLVWQSIGFILIGIGVTAGFVGMQTWCPDVYGAAPSNIGAFISGSFALTATVAIYKLLIQVFPPESFNISEILLFGGILTMSIGNLGALRQKDIRRFLGYSSISQRGYLLFGLGIISKLGDSMSSSISAVYAQGITFMFLEGLLFICFGNILFLYYPELQTRSVLKLEGSANSLHLTGIAIVLASLGLSGLPPTMGFITKLSLVLIASIAKINPQYFIVFIINSLVSISYYIKFVQKLVMKKPSEGLRSVNPEKLPSSFNLTIFLALIICVILSIKPAFWINLLQ